ncbi:hypothetical protein CTA2_6916 [Colletotrichum tanaceti]|uniref:Uncharacterized protein n=1 Tax=Colletotrichum tanaceti TaxID=1306861 RepID=A0A4U6XE55_9PEZI|nr:hypothetical protein CTA2_6916 [Colletotrichum tanaceti]TKW54071.1 hypothetical protein CTA1_5632 [Colletotrichum tanaceti]
MRTLNKTIAFTVTICSIAGATSSPCQTVTSIGSVCPTFFLPACLALSTIQSRCGCPTTVPTTTVDYPCEGVRPTGCMGTSYIYETAVPTAHRADPG